VIQTSITLVLILDMSWEDLLIMMCYYWDRKGWLQKKNACILTASIKRIQDGNNSHPA